MVENITRRGFMEAKRHNDIDIECRKCTPPRNRLLKICSETNASPIIARRSCHRCKYQFVIQGKKTYFNYLYGALSKTTGV